MARNGRIVGIDIAKAKADGCIRSLRLRCSEPSTPEGQAAMLAWLLANGVRAAVMEASGGDERSWAQVLRGAGIAVRILDPKRVRHFAKAAGRLAKNDPIDAETIAWFAETFDDEVGQPHDPAREELDVLVTARTGLAQLLVQVDNQGEHQPPPILAKAYAAVAKSLRTQLKRLDAAITARIKANTGFAERARIIQSVPGLADRTLAGLIAWAPELGHITDKQAAALVGVAPYDDDSGERVGERHIKGGRQELRNLVYMATLGAATRHNPVLKTYYLRLRAKGKKAKVALVACMRKLIVILNTMLARGQTWNPPTPPAMPTNPAAVPAAA
jgi:transposase